MGIGDGAANSLDRHLALDAGLFIMRCPAEEFVQLAAAVAKGWSRDETVERVHFRDRYPVDIGQGYMMDHIQHLNARSLYDKMTA